MGEFEPKQRSFGEMMFGLADNLRFYWGKIKGDIDRFKAKRNFGLFLRFCFVFFVFIVFALFHGACNNITEPKKSPCPDILPAIVPTPPYSGPVWHPSGQFIGFNHIPLSKIEYPYGKDCNFGIQYFVSDSMGFWLINADGTNKRRIFPWMLGSLNWSPDGKWVVFSSGGQIYKMRFTGTTFDTTSLTQLTFEGRNFNPAWSPDGQWIAYARSYAYPEPQSVQGIWIMRSDGTNKRRLIGGLYPSWSPDGKYLIYVGLRSEIYRVDIQDTSKVVRLTSFNQENPYSRDNRYPQYLPDGSKIVFWSDGELWIMDSTGSNLQQLTTTQRSVDTGFSLSPSGDKIVYTYYSNDWTMNNGVLWMLDLKTKKATQFTFNP